MGLLSPPIPWDRDYSPYFVDTTVVMGCSSHTCFLCRMELVVQFPARSTRVFVDVTLSIHV